MRRDGLGNFVELVSNGKDQIANAFASGRGNGVERQIVLGAEGAQFCEMCGISCGVQLSGNDNHGLFAKRRAKSEQFAIDDFVRVYGIGIREIAGVNQVNEQPLALDVAQETNAKARAFVRAFVVADLPGLIEGAHEGAGKSATTKVRPM